MTFCLPGWLDKKGKGAYVSLPVVLQLVFDPHNVAAKPQTRVCSSYHFTILLSRYHQITHHSFFFQIV